MTVLLHMLNVMTNVNVEALIRRNKKELLLLASTKNKKKAHILTHTRSNNLCLFSRRHLKHFANLPVWPLQKKKKKKKRNRRNHRWIVRKGQNNLSPPPSLPLRMFLVLFHPMPRSIQCGVHAVVV